MRRKIVAGNWKLHGDRAFAAALLGEIAATAAPAGVERVVMPPFPYLAELARQFAGRGVQLGAQDVSEHAKGAFTGEVSAAMLADVGVRYVLAGHSERRQYHAEDSALVARKFLAARAAGLVPVLCVGETLAEREQGRTEAVIAAQLAPLFLEATGDMPLLHPRMTAAVAPAQAWDAFSAEGLDLADALRYGPAALRLRLADRAWRAHPASTAFAGATADRWLDGVRKLHGRHFKDAGPEERLERTVAAAWKRYQHGLEKAVYAATAGGKRHLFEHLRWLGNGMGQDRHLGLGSLLHALGRDGFQALRGELDPVSDELQLIEYGTRG